MSRPSVETTGFEAFQPSWSLKVVSRVKLAAGPVEAQLPDVDVAEAGRVAERARLVVALDAGVLAVREDALDLVVEADRGRLVDPLAGREVDRPDARPALRLVAGVGELAVVVEEVLGLEGAAGPSLVKTTRSSRRAGVSPEGSRSATTRRVWPSGTEGSCAWPTEKAIFVDRFETAAPSLIRRPSFTGREPGFAAQEPQLVVARAAAADVLEALRADQQVVRARQVHDAQERRARARCR